ncbi:hypothetical protein J437_LFUL007067 [Ladona fulva]|uniref:Uncharacterized protein n=1 Tax=Ladona fulva TaxID=123851 RepID=A0A8K0K6M9_LADFU|nr:hypothetical protein J437_LFUL007067 [Ladona fulva]
MFTTSQPGAQWIQCTKCKRWAHEHCITQKFWYKTAESKKVNCLRATVVMKDIISKIKLFSGQLMFQTIRKQSLERKTFNSVAMTKFKRFSLGKEDPR